MKKYEYHMQEICFEETLGDAEDDQLLEVFNNLGEDGWRVSSLHINPKHETSNSCFKILFERQIED